jgi:hypothetical protein
VKDKMLERFSTDAYDSMLVASRPGGYRTPRFWLLLNTQILPRISPEMGERLIALGPQNPQAIRTVEGLAAYLRRTKAVTTWLRLHTPWLYAAAGHMLTGLFRRRRRGKPS